MEKKSKLKVFGNYCKNKPEIYVNYTPYLIGRCKEVYEIVEYVYEKENEINRLSKSKRLMTFTSSTTIGVSPTSAI